MKLQIETKDQQIEKEELVRSVHKLEGQLSHLGNEKEELSVRLRESAIEEEAYRKLENQNGTLASEIAHLRSVNVDLEKVIREKNDVEMQLKDSQSYVEALRQSFADDQKSHEQILSEVHTKLSAVNHEASTMRLQVTSLTTQLERTRLSEDKELRKMQQQLESAHEVRRKLMTDLEDGHKLLKLEQLRRQNSEKEARALTATIDDLKNNFKRELSSLSDVRAKLEKKDLEHRESQKESSALKILIEKIKGDLLQRETDAKKCEEEYSRRGSQSMQIPTECSNYMCLHESK